MRFEVNSKIQGHSIFVRDPEDGGEGGLTVYCHHCAISEGYEKMNGGGRGTVGLCLGTVSPVEEFDPEVQEVKEVVGRGRL